VEDLIRGLEKVERWRGVERWRRVEEGWKGGGWRGRGRGVKGWSEWTQQG
jgi:hypothetical protein